MTARLHDLGGLSVEDAAHKISLQVEAIDESGTLFGVKMPPQPFIAFAAVSLVMLSLIFFSSLSTLGSASLPEALQDLPGWMRVSSVLASLLVLPVLGLYLCGQRIRFVSPILQRPIAIA